MASFSLKPIIIVFVVIILGITFLNTIEDSVSETDDIISLTNNESLTWAGNNTAITLANDDVVIGSEIVYNHTTKLTKDTDYTLTKTAITFTNQSAIDPSWDTAALNMSYDHEGVNYVSDTTSRTFLKLIGLFFVLVIIAFVIKTMMESTDNFNFGFAKK